MSSTVRLRRFRSTYVTPARHRALVRARFVGVWRQRFRRHALALQIACGLASAAVMGGMTAAFLAVLVYGA